MGIKTIFRVTFHNQDKIYQLHAKHVNPGPLKGFIELEDLLFDITNSPIIDAGEEPLKREFADVTRLYVPIHATIRIDERQQDQANPNRIMDSHTVTPFPGPPQPAP